MYHLRPYGIETAKDRVPKTSFNNEGVPAQSNKSRESRKEKLLNGDSVKLQERLNFDKHVDKLQQDSEKAYSSEKELLDAKVLIPKTTVKSEIDEDNMIEKSKLL